jgi:hypothetical protein
LVTKVTFGPAQNRKSFGDLLQVRKDEILARLTQQSDIPTCAQAVCALEQGKAYFCLCTPKAPVSAELMRIGSADGYLRMKLQAEEGSTEYVWYLGPRELETPTVHLQAAE